MPTARFRPRDGKAVGPARRSSLDNLGVEDVPGRGGHALDLTEDLRYESAQDGQDAGGHGRRAAPGWVQFSISV